MNFLTFVPIFCIAIFATLITADLPPEIQKCKPADGNCIGRAIEKILQTYPKGNKEFGLVPVDKFTLKDISLSEPNGNGAVQLQLKFRTAEVYGIDKAIINRIVGFEEDLEKSKFEVYGTLPLLTIKGKYDTSGRVLLLPLSGSGDSEIKLKNAKISVKIRAVPEVRDGKRFAKLKKIKVLLEPEGVQVRLDNLFNGNKELGDSMNAVINENWRDIWKELGAGINNFVEQFITGILTQVLDKLPYDDFYKKQ